MRASTTSFVKGGGGGRIWLQHVVVWPQARAGVPHVALLGAGQQELLKALLSQPVGHSCIGRQAVGYDDSSREAQQVPAHIPGRTVLAVLWPSKCSVASFQQSNLL